MGASTDTYALGSVLYEMLVGEPPYPGTTAQAVLGKIIAGKPVSATEQRPSIPANVDAAVRKALEKLAADRFASAQDFAKALTDEHFRYGELATAGAGSGPWKRLTVGFATTTVLLAMVAVWGWLRPSPSTEPGVLPVRASIPDFEFSTDGRDVRFAISRDGSMIVAGSETDGPGLFFSRVDQMEFREIPGTVNATNPTFSPDGEWLAFEQQGEIKRVELSGGGQVLPVAVGIRPHWGSEGLIVFQVDRSLYGVSPGGGEPVLFVDGDSVRASRPFLLPDGEAVVFGSGGNITTRALMLADVESGSVTDLEVVGSNPRYVPTGHLVFGHVDRTLMAVSFDLARHQVTGEPFVVLPDVAVHGAGATQFDVSDNGTALYGLSDYDLSTTARLVEVNLDGVETPTYLGTGDFQNPRYSPDGRRIAYSMDGQVWVYDRETNSNDQFTTQGQSFFPVWSADGRYVYYASFRGNVMDGFRRLADRSREEERLYRHEGYVYPLSSSASGNELLMSEYLGDDRGMNLLIMSEGQDSMTFTEYLRADWDESHGAISPGGRWVAYTSNESGVSQVYVRSFPEATERMPVSVDGGAESVWAPDGTAIYYWDRSGRRMMRALVTPGEEFRVATPQVLFQGGYSPEFPPFESTNWDLHPDGQTFVMITDPRTAIAGPAPSGMPVRLVVNWFEELERLVPN